jgi:hypothetical protein
MLTPRMSSGGIAATGSCVQHAALSSTEGTVASSRPASHDDQPGQGSPRQPAKAGAKRPCGGPLRWSHSHKEGPYAPRSEERSWKRQLALGIRR